MENDTSMKDYLAQHPRMIGALFTLLLLISQSGTAAAGLSSQMGP